jgi:DNA ligase (NAD+)
MQIDGVGEIIAAAYVDYMQDQEHQQAFDRLLKELTLEQVKATTIPSALPLAGKIFVITGALNQFENRSELKDRIERLGGKVASSVSAKTTALVNNDILSSSSKNQKAKELGITILTEDQFLHDYQILEFT